MNKVRVVQWHRGATWVVGAAYGVGENQEGGRTGGMASALDERGDEDTGYHPGWVDGLLSAVSSRNVYPCF